MADSDFYSYSSIYDTFSKGPKSIYYGVGDEMLPGAVLNVPQTDEDDEWGRTQRIADERSYDFIAKIYKTLFDPYNSISDVSLVPGEAGSEINVAKNMIRLIGRSGIDVGVFDLSVPSMTLSDVVIDGDAKSLLIGSGFEATETTLKINTYFEFNGAANEGTITFKDISTSWYDDLVTKNFTISVGSADYIYQSDGSGDPELLLPVGGILHVQGTSKVNGIIPNANEAYDIGSSSLRFSNIYVKEIHGESVVNEYIYTSYIYPAVCSGTLEIGNYGYVDTVNINARTFKIFNESDTIPAFEIYRSGSDDLINVGGDSGNHIINIKAADTGTGSGYDGGFNVYTPSSSVRPALAITNNNIFLERETLPAVGINVNLGSSTNRFSNIYGNSIAVAQGEFTSSITSTGIYPSVTDSYDIGALNLKYLNIYANHLHSEYGVYSTNSEQWYLCGPNLKILNTIAGQVVLEVDSDNIEARVDLRTQDIMPRSDASYSIGENALRHQNIYTYNLVSQYGNFTGSVSSAAIYPSVTETYDLGAPSLKYLNIYATHAHSEYGVYSTNSEQWSLCGPNLNIRVEGSTKMGVCAEYIEMYETMRTSDILPRSSTDRIGHPSGGGYASIYLIDEDTGFPVKVYVQGGVLYP